MKKTFIFGLLAAVLGFSSCCDGDSLSGGISDDVKDVPVEGVTVNVSAVELTLGDDPAQATTTLTATIVPESATDKTVTWSSSDENVATVTSEGVVTAVGKGTATITATTKEGGKSASCIVTVVKAAPAEDPHLLPGYFSVSATKKVKFTKSNLYWDGSDFKFEANPTDYPTTRETTHVGHFFWTKDKDKSYAASYDDGTNDKTDKFFADGNDGRTLTVDGVSGLYVLSEAEWTYLLQTRTNAASLYKIGVTVNGKDNCLVIAPDGFTGTIETSYTLDGLDAAGLVCLPAAGTFNGSSVYFAGSCGYCWSSSALSASLASLARYLFFNSGGADVDSESHRHYGCSLRAVLAE